MPLPELGQRSAYWFDKELELRDYAAAAESATVSETGVELAVRHLDVAKVVIDHAAIGGTVDGSNFWAISVEVSDLVGGSYTEIATTRALGATANQIELPISGLFAEYKDADAAFIRVTATETGTTAGNLTYGAYVTPC